MHVRNPYNYDVDKASRDSSLICNSPSRAQQQFKSECDINVILDRFNVTGQLPVSSIQPTFGDFSGVFDYQSAANAVIAANAAFESLPSKIRKRFENNPQLFVEFCSDESNRDEMIALGLIDRPVNKEESPTEPVQGEAAQ